jgi:hypothetical protein
MLMRLVVGPVAVVVASVREELAPQDRATREAMRRVPLRRLIPVAVAVVREELAPLERDRQAAMAASVYHFQPLARQSYTQRVA